MLQTIINDPEVKAALADPEISGKLMQIMTNPASAAQYASDPKIAALIQKLAPMFGKSGGAGGAGGAGGCPFPGAGASGFGGPGAGQGGEEFDID